MKLVQNPAMQRRSLKSNCSFVEPPNATALEKKIVVNKNRIAFKISSLWLAVNIVILACLLHNIAHTCYFDYHWTIHFIKYTVAFVLALNVLYHLLKILILSCTNEQTLITAEQQKLLGIKDSDPNFKLVSSLPLTPPIGSPTTVCTPISTTPQTPMNTSAASWRSTLSSALPSLSPNQSLNYSLPSPSWTYHKGSGQSSPYSSPTYSPPPDTSLDQVQYRDTSGIDFISNDEELNVFLKDIQANSDLSALNNQTKSTNLLSSFWNHPVVKSTKNISSFLQNSSYQMSTPSPASTSLKGTSEDSPVTVRNSALIAWTGLNVDVGTLTQWNENLRIWISNTILERLVHEFDRIDESLEKQGLSDIKIGFVGLDRLRKTAQMVHVSQYIPTLSVTIPFLEVTPNQEYLVRRIRELAKGGCMSEYKWKGGSSYNGKEWDESLPTDSLIVMHLLISYLDTQLMPTPNQPDVKPFSGHHFIKHKEKMPDLGDSSLYIQHVSEKPPHYRVVVGQNLFEMVKGYSNLFHSILFFLFNVNRKEHGMLGGVHLGRAGVNMLWIIDEE